jgi:hypothetical protein
VHLDRSRRCGGFRISLKRLIYKKVSGLARARGARARDGRADAHAEWAFAADTPRKLTDSARVNSVIRSESRLVSWLARPHSIAGEFTVSGRRPIVSHTS